MNSASRAEIVLRLFVANTPPLDAATIMAVRRVSRRLAAAPLAKHALILSQCQSRQLYALRCRPDVARLLVANVHTLNLSYTPVVDVSALGRVHTLYLSCTSVVDVSALGRVHSLYLGGTPVVDVSALGRVHSLYLGGTRVVDVSALDAVVNLWLPNGQTQ